MQIYVSAEMVSWRCGARNNSHEEITRRQHVGDLVKITGQQEEGILWQMDDRSAIVGEGQIENDTKPSLCGFSGC